uniref:Uncharacterized protein n=1 Tax=Cucumis melo TaxID=3656 RepID=A0A9I9E4Q5_CUCME
MSTVSAKPKLTQISQQRISNDLEYHIDDLVTEFQQLVSQNFSLPQSETENLDHSLKGPSTIDLPSHIILSNHLPHYSH